MRTPIFLLLCSCLFWGLSCKKEKNSGCDNLQSPYLRWKVDYAEYPTSGSYPHLHFTGNRLIIFRFEKDIMEAYHPDTGEQLWSTRLSDLFPGGLSLLDGRVAMNEDYLLLYSYGELAGFSLQDGSLLWRQQIGYKSKIGLSFVKGRFFMQSENSSSPYTLAMHAIQPSNGDLRVLFSVPSQQGYPEFKQPAIWENPASGNTWLLWRLNRSVTAYDLDADSLVYTKPIGIFRDIQAYGLITFGNTLFVPFDTVVYTFAIPEAEITGAIRQNSSGVAAPLFLMGNRVVVQFEPSTILLYDVTSGMVSTQTDDYLLASLNITSVVNDKGLFLGTYNNEMYAVDLERLCRSMLLKSPDAIALRDVAVYPAKNYFYISNRQTLYCYEIP